VAEIAVVANEYLNTVTNFPLAVAVGIKNMPGGTGSLTPVSAVKLLDDVKHPWSQLMMIGFEVSYAGGTFDGGVQFFAQAKNGVPAGAVLAYPFNVTTVMNWNR